MIEPALAVVALGLLPPGQLHGALSTPVPHWLVLLTAVPALWIVVGAAALAVDRLCRRYGL